MSKRPAILFGIIPAAILLLAGATLAQTRAKEGECRPDELDMGDYCASLPPAANEDEEQRRRVTRFRGTSMMPGRTGVANKTMPGPKPASTLTGNKAATSMGQQIPTPAVTPVTPPSGAEAAVPAPVPAGSLASQFIVQLGAFSSETLAASVAASIVAPQAPIHIVPLTRNERVLWACVQGPFASLDEATAARDLLRRQQAFKSAYIKSIDPEIEKGLVYDPTEK
jgi:cell division protein FtsN